jgi:integrase
MPYVFQTVNLKATLAKVRERAAKLPDSERTAILALLDGTPRWKESGVVALAERAGVAPVYHENWRYQFVDHTGRKHTATGTSTEAATEKKAKRKQLIEDEIRDGLRPVPKPTDAPRFWDETVAEYLEWGKRRGGKRKGFGWSSAHLLNRTVHLAWWKERLRATYLHDVCFPDVDKALVELARNHSAKTLQDYAGAVKAFMAWCARRRMLDQNPLADLKSEKIESEHYRLLSSEELARLLEVAPPERGLLYRVALATGYRQGELRALRVSSLDRFGPALCLPAKATKDRKKARQFISPELCAELQALCAGKEAEESLLHVSEKKTCWLNFERDRNAARIPKKIAGQEARATFHSLRECFIQAVVESGADVKTVMEVARHSAATMSFQTYAKPNPARMQEAARAAARAVSKAEVGTMGAQREGTTGAPVTQAGSSEGVASVCVVAAKDTPQVRILVGVPFAPSLQLSLALPARVPSEAATVAAPPPFFHFTQGASLRPLARRGLLNWRPDSGPLRRDPDRVPAEAARLGEGQAGHPRPAPAAVAQGEEGTPWPAAGTPTSSSRTSWPSAPSGWARSGGPAPWTASRRSSTGRPSS